MKNSKIVWIAALLLITLAITFTIPSTLSSALSAEPEPTSAAQVSTTDQVRQAILTAVATNYRYTKGKLVAKLQVTDIRLSADNLSATGWVVYYDDQVGATLPSEPALSVATFQNDQWKALLPSDPSWQDAVFALPTDLLSSSEKDMWVSMNQGVEEFYPTQSGYYLPWHGGQTAYLSRSVGHDADYTTAHFAFDFYQPGNQVCPNGGQANAGVTGLNFNIYAAKAGKVWGWDDSVTNCDHSAVNFIVLQNNDDASIFQLYMHLSQGSIPPELKSEGAPVSRGQFIAIADNTGNSTGSHLHFQIEHQPYWPKNNPYWNTALDVTFDDVDINGGRPRVSPLDPPYCRDTDICDVFRSTYVSGNYYLGDSTPPTGDLSGIEDGAELKTSKITLTASGTDGGSGLAYGQLRAQYDGAWHDIGPQFNPNITYTWNLCAPGASVENGPVSIAATLYDVAGNVAPLVGLRHITKNYSCPVPPPACIPADDQVTLFEEAYFNGGCVKFGIGDYPTAGSLSPLGNDDAESILVGSQVLATAFSEENFSGHSQTFNLDIGYMPYQWLPANTLSSLKVSPKNNPPSALSLNGPVDSTIFRQNDLVPFSWTNGGGALKYRLQILVNDSPIKTTDWQTSPVIYIDSLGQGAYSWRVQGWNEAGEGAWSAASTFTIASPIVIPPAVTVPFSDTMETSQYEWVNTGQWNYKSNSNQAHSGSHSWWYQNSYGNYEDNHPNFGFLTSPRISITAPGYYLRFYYRNQTETQASTWDQRWIQISLDDGPFTNLVQFSDDPQMQETSSWLRNKAIDLTSYAGHIIRIRFQVATLDAANNNLSGWGIDDVSITATPPQTCSENRQDDTPAQAFLLTYDPGITIPGEICPNGDLDYYKFYGNAGDRIVADIDAMKNGSLLDPYLLLLDSDGKTVLAENDDEVYAQRRDSLISFALPRTDTYYLKLRAWKNPSVGGDAYFYTIRLYKDNTKPIAVLTWPSPETFLPDGVMTVTASISEVVNGINRVEFYWHSINWLDGWEKIGTDWDGSDGWGMPFDPLNQAEGIDAAFFVQVYDMAGNWVGLPAWKLGIDKTPPVTAMNALAPSQTSNAFPLQWTGSDNLSGLDIVEIQQTLNNNGWTTFPAVDAGTSRYWIIGDPGNAYAYRMHGVDHSGNSEAYPNSAETSTTVPGADVLCYAPDSFDASGNDNAPGNASLLIVDGASQVHNYCNPLTQNHQNDEDWAKVVVEYGKNYLVESKSLDSPAASIISLYAQDGTTLITETRPPTYGVDTILLWTADRDGTVYIRFRHVDGRVIGTSVTYAAAVRTGIWTFIPTIYR